jgi:hypothetical protein
MHGSITGSFSALFVVGTEVRAADNSEEEQIIFRRMKGPEGQISSLG